MADVAKKILSGNSTFEGSIITGTQTNGRSNIRHNPLGSGILDVVGTENAYTGRFEHSDFRVLLDSGTYPIV